MRETSRAMGTGPLAAIRRWSAERLVFEHDSGTQVLVLALPSLDTSPLGACHRPFSARAFRAARSVSSVFAARIGRVAIMLRRDASAIRSIPIGEVASNSLHASSN